MISLYNIFEIYAYYNFFTNNLIIKNMAEKRVDHIDNITYFFTYPNQKTPTPTKNPDRPNLFNILLATTNFIKDNLFDKNQGGFKFKTSEDLQIEALKKWESDDISFDKKNPQNQDNYLTAIKKIMNKDELFIKKCSESVVSKERIDKIKIYKEIEYNRLKETIMGKSLTISPLNIKLQSEPKDLCTQGDVASEAYRKLQQAQSFERPEPGPYQKVKDGVKGVGKSAFEASRKAGSKINGGAKSVGKAVVRVLDGDPNVNSWRVRDSEDIYDGGLVFTKNFHLEPTFAEKFFNRAGPGSMSFTYKDALKELNKLPSGHSSPSSHVRNLGRQVQENKMQLGQLYGERAGLRLHKKGVRAPGADGRGGR